jgi:TonB family protein
MTSLARRVLTAAVLCWSQPAGADEITIAHLAGLDYPPIAAQAQIRGKVVLRCLLRNDGRVASVEVVSGHPVLSEAASRNASRWVFRVPARFEGKDPKFTLTYDFKLMGTCRAPNCASDFTFDSPDTVTVTTQARSWNPSSNRD